MAHRWRPSSFLGLSRANKPDAAGNTDVASKPDAARGKPSSNSHKSTKKSAGPGGKRWQDPFPRFRPSLPEAGEDNGTHQEIGFGPGLELLMPVDSRNKGTLLEQIEKNHEGFELM